MKFSRFFRTLSVPGFSSSGPTCFFLSLFFLCLLELCRILAALCFGKSCKKKNNVTNLDIRVCCLILLKLCPSRISLKKLLSILMPWSCTFIYCRKLLQIKLFTTVWTNLPIYFLNPNGKKYLVVEHALLLTYSCDDLIDLVRHLLQEPVSILNTGGANRVALSTECQCIDYSPW